MSQAPMVENSRHKPSAHLRDLGYRIAARTAVVVGVFSLLVAVMLLVDYGKRQVEDPMESPDFKTLKAKLVGRPGDEHLKEQVRDLDLRLRQQYFRQRRFTEMGAWLLLGGVVVFLIAAKSAATLRRKLPTPEPQAAPRDVETPMTRIARWSVAALALVLVGTAITLNLSFRSELASLSTPSEPEPGPAGKPPGELAKPSLQPGEFPSDEEIRKNWHRFRGPGGSGISAYDNVPTSWDASSGEGILWRTAVPLPGNSSPVVWNGKVFLSGATEDTRQVYCFDAGGGELLWQKDVPSTLSETLKADDISPATGFAAPTTTTDGKRVFAIFANGDMAGLDFGGNLVWARSLGIPDNHYGHASSLEVYRNLLLVQFDQGRVKEGKSKLLALDTLTGKTVYEVARPVDVSWTSPCLTTVGGRVQLITGADPWVIAYNPADGSEIWRADCLSGESGPSAVALNGVVYMGNEYCVMSAIRADGQGDVTETHISWTADEGLSDTCSPLVTPEYLFLVAYELYCYDVKTGELLWDTYDEINFETTFSSSPSWAGGRVYLFGEDGKAWIIEPSREKGKVVAENNLAEECVASPAFQDGRIYVRAKDHLFCIGQK